LQQPFKYSGFSILGFFGISYSCHRPEYRVREDLAIFSFFKFVKKQARGFVKVNATKAITIPQNQTCSFSFSDNQQN
jgi:hypothetical protein